MDRGHQWTCYSGTTAFLVSCSYMYVFQSLYQPRNCYTLVLLNFLMLGLLFTGEQGVCNFIHTMCIHVFHTCARLVLTWQILHDRKPIHFFQAVTNTLLDLLRGGLLIKAGHLLAGVAVFAIVGLSGAASWVALSIERCCGSRYSY